MRNAIYLIDPATKAPVRVEQVSLAEIGIKERADLEAWVVSHPDLLGEPLLVVSVEYDGFKQSNKRLDVLAIDSRGALVIIELKLDMAGSHADLQAIRYAALCSKMTTEELIGEFASNRGVNTDEAESMLLDFLGRDELPLLKEAPRIILAAGSMDDQEITSCALWLRRFLVDIRCVELSPYRMPNGSLVLVPRVIVPLQETQEFTEGDERKQATDRLRSKSEQENADLWSRVKSHFNGLNGPLKVSANSYQDWLVVKGGSDPVHYAWWRLRKKKAIWIGIGFRSKSARDNDDHMDLFRPRQAELSSAMGTPLRFQDDWGKGSPTRRMYVELPYDGTQPLGEIGRHAAERMAKLIELTLPTLATHDLHPS